MESQTEVTGKGGPGSGPDTDDSPHLKSDAISFTDGLVIALASTAPAYSLAAVIGSIVVLVGVQAPAALILSFVPMFLIATAFYYMNKADQDCGTSFSWVTRAIGPHSGWMAGWAICVTGILIVGSLADVAVYSFFDLIGAEGLVDSIGWVTAGAVALMVLMTWVCIWGTNISANLQKVLMSVQLVPLLLFVGVAFYKIFTGDGPAGSINPSLSWFNPLEIEWGGALSGALLLGVFIYWGWESAVNLNEETDGEPTKPGLAGVISTTILLVTYLGVAAALIAWGGVGGAERFDDDASILPTFAKEVLGGTLGPLVLLSIVVSALASTQTTILPAARTSLSMARAVAMPEALSRISPRFFTPWVSTAVIGVLAIIWYLPAKLISQDFLFDSLSALSLMIAFYYAITGFACAIYYRHELRKSVRNFFFVGVAPVVGGLLLVYLFVQSLIDWSDPANSYTGQSWFGFAPPATIGIGFLLLGVVAMFFWRRHQRLPFFGRKPEVADPELLSGKAEPAPALAGRERLP